LWVGVGSAAPDAPWQLNGAGETFPYVIYSKWFGVYIQKRGVRFNCQSIRSGGGIKQVMEGTVDFGTSDVSLLDDSQGVGRQNQQRNIRQLARWIWWEGE
jgi:ABC-type phosphate transport system substrate-binding protein